MTNLITPLRKNVLMTNLTTDDDARCVLHTTRQVSASGRSGGNWHRLAIRHRVSITSYNTVIG